MIYIFLSFLYFYNLEIKDNFIIKKSFEELFYYCIINVKKKLDRIFIIINNFEERITNMKKL